MSVALIQREFIRKLVVMVCLPAFYASAQQANTALSVQSPAKSGPGGVSAAPQQPGEPVSGAPEPKPLPAPFAGNYSKPVPLLPNPFARYKARRVPQPIFTNTPRILDLIQNGKLMLSLNDAIAVALADNLDIAIALNHDSNQTD